MARCPHCGGVTVIEAHRRLRWVCGACGGPRVPADVPAGTPLARSNSELASLVRAQRTRAMAFGWRAAGVVLALGALLGVGAGALVFLFAHLAGAIVSGVGALSLVAAFALFSRARSRDAEVTRELDDAWQSVANEVVDARSRVGAETTAAELSRIMRTDEARSEKLLAALSATDRVRMEIGDDAELRYQSGPPLRIADAEVDDAAGGANAEAARARAERPRS